MIPRAARLAAAAAALVLAASQTVVWRAEQAYERGLDAAEEPARDAPGRLEAYEEAVRTDPGNPLYALRAAQVALARASRRPPPPERPELVAGARRHLAAAVRLQPLDGRTHDALAQLAAEEGDLDGVLARTRLAVLVGPRRPSGLDRAARRLAWLWRRTRDPEVLTAAIETARLGFELLDGRAPSLPELRGAPGTGATEELLASPGGPALDDLVLAVRGRLDLLPTAERLTAPSRPEDAARLRAAAGGR